MLVADIDAHHDRVGGKRSVLCQRGVVPAVFDKLACNQITGTLYSRCNMESGAGAAFKPDGSEPMQGIACRNPVVIKVFGISVGSDDFLPAVKSVIHAIDVIAL